jgi:predicted secreted hydrolase
MEGIKLENEEEKLTQAQKGPELVPLITRVQDLGPKPEQCIEWWSVLGWL